jgi:hypothetical protein
MTWRIHESKADRGESMEKIACSDKPYLQNRQHTANLRNAKKHNMTPSNSTFAAILLPKLPQ